LKNTITNETLVLVDNQQLYYGKDWREKGIDIRMVWNYLFRYCYYAWGFFLMMVWVALMYCFLIIGVVVEAIEEMKKYLSSTKNP
jgi:hypothetical protein